MKILKYLVAFIVAILTFVLIAGIVYLIFSFVDGDINCMVWSAWLRLLWIVIGVSPGMYIAILMGIHISNFD